MKAYKLLSSLIDEATLNVSKLCEHDLECVLISKTQHSMYLNCLKGTLVVIIINYIRNRFAADYEAVRK